MPRAAPVLLVLALASCVSTQPVDAGAPPKLRVFPASAEGDVTAAVRAQLAASQKEHRTLLVYVGAKWCEPCERFHHAAEAGALDKELGDVDLLMFDLDRDAERLSPFGYDSQYIPLLVVPAEDGRASPRRMEGSVKGEGALANMVPRVKELLGR
jgi:thiol-disulfide isomerase/thioredoxin